jgi:protein-S-isoprenylcysteine O-methyltransferase Ste14
MMRVPPPLVALVAASAQRALTGATPAPNPGPALVSATLCLASMALAGTAAGQFRRSGTTVEPFHPERASALVTTGANSISRNPMYVGMAGVLVAHALWRRSWAALLPAAGFVLFVDRLQIEPEESALAEKFAGEYEAYRSATPRWLGWRSFG